MNEIMHGSIMKKDPFGILENYMKSMKAPRLANNVKGHDKRPQDVFFLKKSVATYRLL